MSWKWVTSLAGVSACIASLAASQPRTIADPVRSPVVWRALKPWVTAFGDGDPLRAVSYLRGSLALAHKLDGPLTCDAPTCAFRSRSLASLADFDLKDFYSSLPDHAGPVRSFAFSASPTERGYHFERSKGPAFELRAGGTRRGFGELSGGIEMRHLEANDQYRYLLKLRGGAGVGAVRWRSVVAGAEDALRVLAPRAPVEPGILFLQTLESRLAKRYPALAAEDRRVLAALMASFPVLSELLKTFVRVDDVIGAGAPDTDIIPLRFDARLELAALRQGYPQLASFLRRFGDLISGTARVFDARGHRLLELRFDSGNMHVHVGAFVRDGQLVPSRSGAPLATETADFERLRAQVTLSMRAAGLHMQLDRFVAEIQTEQHTSGAALAIQIKQSPRFRVTGNAFGVIPAGMLDWFVPGDIETLARKMMDVTMHGNGGQGVTLNARFEQPDSALATLDGDAALEILDTVLIRFGMRIAADRVMPDDGTSEDIRRLLNAFRTAFSADIERFARYAPTPG